MKTNGGLEGAFSPGFRGKRNDDEEQRVGDADVGIQNPNQDRKPGSKYRRLNHGRSAHAK